MANRGLDDANPNRKAVLNVTHARQDQKRTDTTRSRGRMPVAREGALAVSVTLRAGSPTIAHTDALSGLGAAVTFSLTMR